MAATGDGLASTYRGSPVTAPEYATIWLLLLPLPPNLFRKFLITKEIEAALRQNPVTKEVKARFGPVSRPFVLYCGAANQIPILGVSPAVFDI